MTGSASPAADRPRIGLAGCGAWGRNLARNFHSLGALAAVHDRDEATARDVGGRFGVPILSFDGMLRDPAVDAVVVATPAAHHAAMARQVIEAGKHLFVEKPLALDVGEAEALGEAAAARSRVLMVGHLLQYHPAFLRLKALCEEGALGRLRYVYSTRLSLGRFRTEENALWSFAPHDVSMVLALLGRDVAEVTAVGHTFLDHALADVTHTNIRFATGTAAHIFVSWLHPYKEQRLVVVGDAAMAVFNDGLDWAGKLVVYRHAVTWRDGLPTADRAEGEAIELEAAEPLAVECAHFLDCVAGGTQPRTDADEALAVLRVLDSADRSIREGRSMAPEENAAAAFVHETACVDPDVVIGAGTRIWHFAHLLPGTRIGAGCNVGQNVMIGPDVTVGDRCKIQNNVSLYKGVTLENGVFCGPSAVFTNVLTPRAEVDRRGALSPTLVRRGATIGANATIVCGHTIGRYAFVAAGAVVTRDVPDHAVVLGNPARIAGWACICGERLPQGAWTRAACRCGRGYVREGERVSPEGGVEP